MKKLLMFICAMIACNAYGEEVGWFTDNNTFYKMSSCTSGGNITQPTDDPEKTGYKFKGWRGFSEPQNWKQMICFTPTSYTPTTSESQTTWSATYEWGSVTGERKCSSTGGTDYATDSTNFTKSSSPSATSGQNCWCKLTSMIFKGSSVGVSTRWVLRKKFTESCLASCANFCGSGFRNYRNLRSGMSTY